MDSIPTWSDVQREITSQADVMSATLRDSWPVAERVALLAAEREIDRLLVVGAGASLHAAQAMRWWIEDLTELPCEPMGSLEYYGYGYRRDTAQTLIIVISASGRPSLTIDALQRALSGPALVAGVSDAHQSPFCTEVQIAFPTRSAKCTGWPTQTTTVAMTVLASLAVALARPARRPLAMGHLGEIPGLMDAVLSDTKLDMQHIAGDLQKHEWFGFVGSGPSRGVANNGTMLVTMATADGALALETEEFHHGGQADAMIREGAPLFIIAASGMGQARAEETVQKIVEGGGLAIQLGEEKAPHAYFSLKLPRVTDSLSPFLYLLPLHWFTYHLAFHKSANQKHHQQGMLLRALNPDPLQVREIDT